MRKHFEKTEKILARQLKLLSKDAEHAMGSELLGLTESMIRIIKTMSIPYFLRMGIVFIVILHALIGFVVFIKYLLRRKAR